MTSITIPRTAGPRGRVLPLNLSTTSLGASAAGAASAIPWLPAQVSALLLLTFVLVGPGCAVLAWSSPLRASATLVFAPALGICVVVLVSTAAASFSWWHPISQLVVLVVASAGAALLRLRRPASAERTP